MIYGNIDGIRKTILNELENIYKYKIPREFILTDELASIIVNISESINREISIAVDRKGNIVSVSIGDLNTVEISGIFYSENKLSGVRIIHTHLNGNPKLSNMDISALIKLKLDCIASITVDYNDGGYIIDLGFCNIEDNTIKSVEIGPLSIEETLEFDFLGKINVVEDCLKNVCIEEKYSERAILVGIESEESIDELEELAKACNVQTLNKVLQVRNHIDSAYFVGKGKMIEIQRLVQTLNANVVIFDDELSASQVRNLENNIEVKIIDRTTLILEIFARRAKSSEAKLQVELAQLRYRLPRLIGLGTVLSRTGAGIGTRGPGEKKLEIDKRHIRERINDIKKELHKHKKNRNIQREKRIKRNIPQVSLVGYTNAGKSTLRNKLCDIATYKETLIKEKVFEADMLFATLDTTTRAIVLPDNRIITISDTVGFIRKLPHDLVEAFKSTLEEVINSDVLIHVIDVSSDSFFEELNVVNKVLEQLGADDKKIILVLNKIDKIEEDKLSEIRYELKNITENEYIEISAAKNVNLDLLLYKISKSIPEKLFKKEFIIPYSHQEYVAYIYRNGKALAEEYKNTGTYIKALVDEETYNKCKKFEM